MKKTRKLLTLVLICVCSSTFGQVFSGSASINVATELVNPITVFGSQLDFNKVVIPAVGFRYYHVTGDGDMYSSTNGGAAAGAQTDFEGNPTVSNITVSGSPNTAFNWSAGAQSDLTNASGSIITFTPQYYTAGTTLSAASNQTLDVSGSFSLTLGGMIKVTGLNDSAPSTPGLYTGITTLTVQY